MRALSTGVLEDEDDVRDVRVASEFRARRRRQIDLLEVDGRPVRRLAEVLERDVLHAHVDLFPAARSGSVR